MTIRSIAPAPRCCASLVLAVLVCAMTPGCAVTGADVMSPLSAAPPDIAQTPASPAPAPIAASPAPSAVMPPAAPSMNPPAAAVAPSMPTPASPAPLPSPALDPMLPPAAGARVPTADFLADGNWQVDCGKTPVSKPECAMPIAPGSMWSIDAILALSKQDVLDLWAKSPAVEFAELDGDYIGLLPNAGNPQAQRQDLNNMFNENGLLGYWYGKSFKAPAEGEAKSEGYNRWRKSGEVIHSLRFSTEGPGKSLLDGSPAYMMYYNPYNPSMQLIDEVRQIDEHFFAGCGHEAQECGHFVLVGPIAAWKPF